MRHGTVGAGVTAFSSGNTNDPACTTGKDYVRHHGTGSTGKDQEDMVLQVTIKATPYGTMAGKALKATWYGNQLKMVTMKDHHHLLQRCDGSALMSREKSANI